MKVLELSRERLTDGELPATFKDDAPSPFPAISSAPSIEGVSHSFYFLGREFLVEIGETAKATLSQPVRLFQYGLALRRTRSLSMAFTAAQLALGQRMYAAGIDDGKLGAQIARLQQEINRAKAGGVPTRAQEDVSKNLFRLLAECALEEDAPLPGADAEYAAARELQSMLARHNTALGAIGASFIPNGRIGWRRVAIGFGTISFFSFLAIAKMCG